MPAYAITVTCVVAVSSVMVFLIFYRMKVLNFKTLLSVTLASLVSALGMPAVFSLVSNAMNGSAANASSVVTLLVSLAVYLLIVVILSIIISFIINGAGLQLKKQGKSENADDPEKASVENENYLEQIFVNFIGEHEQNGADSPDSPGKTAQAPQIEEAEGTASLEEASVASETWETAETLSVAGNDTVPVIENASAIDEGLPETDIALESECLAATDSTAAGISTASGDDSILANIDESTAVVENNLEISVDSYENIDKMGIENIVHNRNSLTIEDCINEAFRLKGTGDFEGAILHHMCALDKKPGKELTFWIILDICVMYKSLGQQELALDILNSYYEAYGDTMDISVKDEIRRNLAAVQA